MNKKILNIFYHNYCRDIENIFYLTSLFIKLLFKSIDKYYLFSTYVQDPEIYFDEVS